MTIEIAMEAGKRWLSREKKRQRLTAEGPMNAEPRERIQARLDHLRTAAARPAPALSRAVIDSIAQERVIGRPDFLGIQVLELGAAVARYVARINVRDRLNNTVAFGTGFMVSPRLLMTNNHVLPDADSARGSVAEFDYQANWLGQPPPVKMFALEPDTFFLTDKQLDYTLVAVAMRTALGVALSDYAWMRLVAAQGKILLNDPVSIIQHPNGEMKQIAFRDGRLVDLPGEFAHYTTDTEPGSSGSPVTNDQWEVVALHHSGVPKMRDGDLVSRRDGIWRQGDPPEDLVWVANEGIRVSALVGSIRSKPLSGAQDRLRGELLDLEPPHPVELAYRVFTRDKLTAPPPPPERLGGHESLSPSGCSVTDSGLGVTLSIPLTVTVRFGDGRASGSLDALPPPAKVTTETTLAFEKAVQPIVDPDYSNRRGYAPDFLGIPVPLPTVRQPSNVATLEDGDPVIPYQHFSIVVQKQRRLALFTASNVDGSPSARKPEPGDYSRKGLTGLGESDQEQWLTDPRLPEAQQLPDKFYTKDKGAFDKGHIVRREDVCWGTSYDEVRRANGDTSWRTTS
jgi:endonuclease G